MRLEPQQRIYVCFFLFAVSMGAMLSRLPDLQDALQIDKSELGLTLIGAAIGALISLTFASPIVARLGARKTAFITVLGTSASLALVPWMGVAPLVFAILLCEGLLAGALEINLNVEIDRIEAQLGRGVMNRAHGFWSLGFFVTALVSSAIRQAGISMQLHLALTFTFVLIVGSLVIAGMRNAPARPMQDHPEAGHIALPTFGLLPLCVIGIAAFLVEGAGIDWSAIYMRDVFHVEPFVGGLGLTLFTFFMALARLFADRFVDHFGSRTVALSLLLLSTAGLCSVWVAPHPNVALLGFALMGAGCSAVYPLAVSAAAQRTDRPAHVNVAALGQMSFVVFFLAPPLLGFVAEHAGIRTAYLVCIPVILAALMGIGSLSARRSAFA
ncbi:MULTISPECIES: MFS transporter [Rhizobium]|uniref:MFS family permease n=1 Tax=Rhizobium tropici TaxID=398 RepID=A0A6P1CAY5_RHITR|nr:MULTISPECIES: MFS transporter [Rhizobium]AGB75708.1 major facilitator superfamily (MFS) transporter [Rhizobium tropici CIAT 899]MBB4244956.1 MFS family permease [Rhizobium tropici]MBB5595822.1 MFS family permease [Rhizobium tropici]MBB6495299.1 MFS family permease [Rhizobium tropici]NEV14288.1 MFS transporter [Rhizobium tropici]